MINRNKHFLYLLIWLIFFTSAGSSHAQKKDREIPPGEFWKQQGTEKVMDYWTKHAVDQENGAFHTFLDRHWEHYNGTKKYPGMISRHIFSYSVGYMLTGNKKYLELATEAKDYIIENAWDKKYGGWYDALSREGKVTDSTKDGFYQTYAITGLAMYYMVTHDKEVLDLLQKSHKIMTEKAWDEQYGGYFRELNRDLTVAKDNKSFSPQFAPLSGYQVYLYMATREKQYLEQMEKMMKVALDKIRKHDSPWVLEKFDREWNYTYQTQPNGTELNTGHNAEVVWMLLRLHELTGNSSYREEALAIAEPLYNYGLNDSSGVWYHRIGLNDPSNHSSSSPWWIQAYGNMLSIYLYDQTGEARYLEAFRKGAEFWNRYFIDDRYGGAYLSVKTDGSILKGAKAVRTKTSYHSLEHSLLNYLYTNLWVKKKPVTLYYFVNSSKAGGKLYPLPIEDEDTKINLVKINGNKYKSYDSEKGYINLPKGKNLELKVELESANKEQK
ncbi:MAG: AGE family epimerase/isomerase [Bacteroidales bacterium]|nr:AGE family epimerase/isomerase [Bacteroidales bacterium]